jgi:hypothetical protein
MKKNFLYIFLLVILTSINFSCRKHRGCTDSKALNRNYDADVNDGSCIYSTATFYASSGYYNGVPISGIDVILGGNIIGTITSVFPSGPGNCSAFGTVPYTFQNGSMLDWNTIVHLSSGAVVYNSGQVEPSSVLSCIRVNVTR